MRNDPFKPGMSEAACRAEMLASIGRQLEKLWPLNAAPMPAPMRELVARIGAAEATLAVGDEAP